MYGNLSGCQPRAAARASTADAKGGSDGGTDESLRAVLCTTPSRRGVPPLLSAAASTFRRPKRVAPEAVVAASDTAKHNSYQQAEDFTLRRIPNRLRRLYSLFVFLLSLVIFLTIIQELWLWLFTPAGCEQTVVRGEDCERDGTVVLFVVGKQMVCTVVVLALLFSRVWDITRHRRRLRGARDGGDTAFSVERRYTLPADHWTAVASLNIFEETSRMVAMAQLIVLTAVGSSTAIATVAQVRNSMRRYDTFDGQVSVVTSCCPACAPFDESCPCDIVCTVSNAGMEAFLTLNVGLLTCLLASLVFIPLAIWSPVADAAFHDPLTSVKSHHMVLRRTRALPVPVAALASLTSICIAVYAGNFLAPATFRGPVLWYLVLGANVVSTVGLLGLLVWSAGVRRLAMLPIFIFRIGISALQSARRAPNLNISERRRRRLRKFTRLWRCNGSWRYRRLALLCACVYCFVIEALNIQAQGVPELYIGRLLTLFLLLLTRDAETEPASLMREGAGFGLLVSARALRAALKAHLRGEPYSGRMPRYKATQLRMQETLAVSYRWHDENSVDLGNGLELNMTHWQATAILQGIETTRCLYCWIDNLAIPSDSELRSVQKTLLSRMMAVYSSALVTLALRSREVEGDRYHQRVWTLQEFCAAQSLIVITEEGTELDGDLEQGSLSAEFHHVAIMDGEDSVIEALRREFLERQPRCEPVWLTKGGATGIMRSIRKADVERIWETYQMLAARLHCRYRADTVRALYPLLWNRPAESEPELVALLEALEKVHGISQVGLVHLLRESSTRDFKQDLPATINKRDNEEAPLDGIAATLAELPEPGRTLINVPRPILAWSGDDTHSEGTVDAEVNNPF